MSRCHRILYMYWLLHRKIWGQRIAPSSAPQPVHEYFTTFLTVQASQRDG